MSTSSDELKTYCHPDGVKSCGACCGMYNHIEHGREQTRARILERTQAYVQTVRIDDEQSLKAFRRRWEDGAEDKLLTGLPSCPFLGFVDFGDADSPRVVGCLVHPLQNDGIDGRDCGIYDRFVCEDYLCAAHDVLRREEVRLVVDAIDGSYLYGLLITNPRFVRHLLTIVADETGARPTAKVLRTPEVIDAAGRCFALFDEWPYRGGDGIFGQVKVAGELDTERRAMPADVFGVDAERVDPLLVCLGTECETVEELEAARRCVRRPLEGLIAAVEAAQP